MGKRICCTALGVYVRSSIAHSALAQHWMLQTDAYDMVPIEYSKRERVNTSTAMKKESAEENSTILHCRYGTDLLSLAVLFWHHSLLYGYHNGSM